MSRFRWLPTGSPFEERPFRRVFERVRRPLPPHPEIVTAYTDGQVTLRSNRSKDGYHQAADLSGFQGVDVGDFVVHGLDILRGSVGVSDSTGALSSVCIVCVPRVESDPRFFAYAIRAQAWAGVPRALAKGVREGGADFRRWDTLAELPLPVPSRHEQRAIVGYLDIETDRIDALVTKKHSLIKLLDEQDRRTIDDLFDSVMRDRRTRLGYVADVRSGVTLGGIQPKATNEITVPYLRVANVQHDRLDLSEVKTVTVDWPTSQRTMLRSGDVLMTEGGDIDKLGRGTVWRGEIDPCLHQNHVFAVRVRTRDLLPEFLALVTRTSYARRYFEMTGVRSTNLASTNASKVSDFRIPYPSLEVQLALVRKYQRKWDALDRARTAMSRQLDLLAERRQALITAVVTGEVQVPRLTV